MLSLPPLTEKKRRHIAILGSTGSIGVQALEVIAEQPQHFVVEVLTAGNNAALLVEQALKFKPNAVVIGNEDKFEEVRDALAQTEVKIYAGAAALKQIVEIDDIDMVLTALVGFAGLEPTVAAIKAGKHIALANKETLVVAGGYITKLAQEHNVMIMPVDSEHSAIFQCLVGEQYSPIEKIYLTCSGGPFRGRTRQQLDGVSCAEALNHPNWDMGAKITIDSATLMNKGLEVIEAKWLFGLKPKQIEVIVHPQSIIHSIVQFKDGSMKAQMGLPDMKLPIQYALGFPLRLANNLPRFSFLDFSILTFEQPDIKTFKNLALAYNALEQGGNMPCVLNAANEIAVQSFLQNKIDFLKMPEIVSSSLEGVSFIKEPTLQDYIETDKETRALATQLIN